MTPPDRLRRYGPYAFLLGCFALCALQQSWLSGWFIEDSAISFAYARNWVDGHGLVPTPGGERIEGFSNPLWVVLLAVGEVFGLSGFDTAKPMALGFSGLALILAWRLGLRIFPEDGRQAWALLPPALLASSSVFNSWAASGLENALFGALLLGALLRQLGESRDGTPVWSPLLWLLLALTRPEGLLYAAVAGLWFAVDCWRQKRGLRPVLRWVALFWVPGLALIAARLAYFAWPLPMTYYGKVGSGGYQLFTWESRGWTQIRTYATSVWEVYWIPLYLTGLFGLSHRGWAGVVALSVGLAGAFFLQLPALVVGILVLAPLGALGRDGWRWRTMLWSVIAVSILFPAYANGDWMRGYRWMSLLAPSASVLLAVGIREVVVVASERVPVAWRGLTALTIVGLFVGGLWGPKHWENAGWFVEEGKNTTPQRIRRRVAYTDSVAEGVGLDEQLVNLDMDMGAYLWFSDQWMVDMAGLVDVPIAVHTWADRAFVDEYLLTERRPHLAHVHGHWAGTTELPSYTRFKRDWFELPAWKDGPGRMHRGEYLRRDLVFDVSPAWLEGPGFAGGLTIADWSIEPVISRGRSFSLTVRASAPARLPGAGVRLIAFLAGPKGLQTWNLPLDRHLPMHRWRAGEVYVGRYALHLSGETALGEHELGFALIGPGGRVLASHLPAENPRFARGEARVGTVRVARFAEGPRRADARLDEAMGAADAGLCERASELWTEAQRIVPRDSGWRRERSEGVGAALARCWVGVAEREPEREVDALTEARRWSSTSVRLNTASGPVADRLYAEGMAARADGDWELAYQRFTEVLGVEPWRAWARRRAEEARNHRLGLGPLPIWGRATRAEKVDPAP